MFITVIICLKLPRKFLLLSHRNTFNKPILMIQNDSISQNHPQILTTKQGQTSSFTKLFSNIVRFNNPFSFITLNQWIILFVSHILCLSFLIFACLWID